MLSKQRMVVSSKINGDASRANFILHKWIVENYGERCPIYEKGCPVCEAWDYYDGLKIGEVDKTNLFAFNSDNALERRKQLELKKRSVESFFDKVKDYPEAVDYLKKLVLYTNPRQ